MGSAEVEHDPVGSQYGGDDVGQACHASNGFNRELDAALHIDTAVLVNALHKRVEVNDDHQVSTTR
jgi:hypothetical protein